jgi:hypothetical protein
VTEDFTWHNQCARAQTEEQSSGQRLVLRRKGTKLRAKVPLVPPVVGTSLMDMVTASIVNQYRAE